MVVAQADNKAASNTDETVFTVLVLINTVLLKFERRSQLRCDRPCLIADQNLRHIAEVESTIGIDVVVEVSTPALGVDTGRSQTSIGLTCAASNSESVEAQTGEAEGQIRRFTTVFSVRCRAESRVSIVVASSVRPGIAVAAGKFIEGAVYVGSSAISPGIAITAGAAVEVVARTTFEREGFGFGDLEIEITITHAIQAKPEGPCRSRSNESNESGRNQHGREDILDHLKELSLPKKKFEATPCRPFDLPQLLL